MFLSFGGRRRGGKANLPADRRRRLRYQPQLEALEDRSLLSSSPLLLKDIIPGSVGSTPDYLTAVGRMLFFAADDGVHARELWKSDGTPPGTTLVKDIR